jgi:hypothetical protein
VIISCSRDPFFKESKDFFLLYPKKRKVMRRLKKLYLRHGIYDSESASKIAFIDSGYTGT